MAESISGDATALPPASWNQQCSQQHLAEIADSISDWRAVSPYLGLTEAEENAILGASPYSVPAQKIAMLRKWKQKEGAKATYKRLCRVFRKRGSSVLQEKITELLVAESSSSSDEEGEKHAKMGRACKHLKSSVVLTACMYLHKCIIVFFTVTAGIERPTKQHVRGDQGMIGIPALINCYGTILC